MLNFDEPKQNCRENKIYTWILKTNKRGVVLQGNFKSPGDNSWPACKALTFLCFKNYFTGKVWAVLLRVFDSLLIQLTNMGSTHVCLHQWAFWSRIWHNHWAWTLDPQNVNLRNLFCNLVFLRTWVIFTCSHVSGKKQKMSKCMNTISFSRFLLDIRDSYQN